ncbi:MAG: hypothetical protein PHP44_02275 [Kiritimatiellae bacterium]|nr:hypothetical protein [Kiritimatiellia bacterium]
MKALDGFLRGVWVLLLAGVTVGYAMDNGAPIFLDNQEGALRLEAIYDRFNREVKIGSVKDDMDQDVYMLRLNVANDVAVTYFDVGVLDDDRKDGSTPPVVGAGVYYTMYESDYLRLNALVNGHYVPKYDTKSSGYKGEFDYYEFAASLVLSGKIDLMSGGLFLSPYAGGGYSLLRGSYKVNIDPPADGISKLDYDLEERDPVVGMVGLAVVFSDRVSARLEYAFLSDSSISAAVGVSF